MELLTRFSVVWLYIVTDQKACGFAGGSCPGAKVNVYLYWPLSAVPVLSVPVPA